jgi:DNA-binding transcriptional MerR regulator
MSREKKMKETNDGFLPGGEDIPEKMFYQIREISELTGVKPHVLRYWETEFSQLRPDKGSTGQRIYREKDLKTIRRIKTLLYDEKFTIAGAKRRLAGENRPEKSQMDLKLGLRENHLLNTILKAKRDLENLLQILHRPERL